MRRVKQTFSSRNEQFILQYIKLRDIVLLWKFVNTFQIYFKKYFGHISIGELTSDVGETTGYPLSKYTCLILTFVTTTTTGIPRLSVSTFSSSGRRTLSSSFIPDLLLSSVDSSGSTYSWNCRTTTTKEIKREIFRATITNPENKLRLQLDSKLYGLCYTSTIFCQPSYMYWH